MTLSSTTILERFRRGRPRDIDLTLRPAYRDLLHKLGHPQNRLPPVFHVAGTNGKGSTCAFLRAMLEAAGYRVHVYTSPHLVDFHERIRTAGKLIGEDELVDILTECEKLATPGSITYFEAATAAAFVAFARHPADFTILETGLGGRLDATNVIEKPLATLITRISYDHREYLGETLGEIAREKVGIMRAGVPCFAAAQPDAEARTALQTYATTLGTPLFIGGKDWQIEPGPDGFRFMDGNYTFDLPPPALLGAHQFGNAGLAIATLLKISNSPLTRSLRSHPLPPQGGEGGDPSRSDGEGEGGLSNIISRGLRNVEWPARLQRLQSGKLPKLLPPGWELWLDGGHNDSAGEVLAAQAEAWRAEGQKPLHLIVGMLRTKNPAEFLAPLASHAASLRAVNIPDEAQSFSADDLAALAHKAGIKNTSAADDIPAALRETTDTPGRILICGSLYLAGKVLADK